MKRTPSPRRSVAQFSRAVNKLEPPYLTPGSHFERLCRAAENPLPGVVCFRQTTARQRGGTRAVLLRITHVLAEPLATFDHQRQRGWWMVGSEACQRALLAANDRPTPPARLPAPRFGSRDRGRAFSTRRHPGLPYWQDGTTGRQHTEESSQGNMQAKRGWPPNQGNGPEQGFIITNSAWPNFITEINTFSFTLFLFVTPCTPP
ncbi:hypothetical protein LZ30DRAFT_424235 [Colletotrichum cereale]|nr:hypothetical protein LZ30DRAFT_424235 [Colletotrichum cereale]